MRVVERPVHAKISVADVLKKILPARAHVKRVLFPSDLAALKISILRYRYLGYFRIGFADVFTKAMRNFQLRGNAHDEIIQVIVQKREEGFNFEQ